MKKNYITKAKLMVKYSSAHGPFYVTKLMRESDLKITLQVLSCVRLTVTGVVMCHTDSDRCCRVSH